jgi:hypothetical protein
MPSTNRDIYLAIGEIAAGARSDSRDLETYLRALLGLCRARRTSPTLSSDEFLGLLRAAFSAEPLAYDRAWENGYADDVAIEQHHGYDRFETMLRRQIVDLHEMRAAGILDGKYIYFGVDSPRGQSWYNFDPGGFLECAAAGSIGGWEPGDPGGRGFVPGDVAVIGADGQITSANPEDVERPIYEVGRVTWERFENFLYLGQVYE